MKNTERLPDDLVSIFRYMHTGDEKDTSRDDVINLMTPSELFKDWLAWRGIVGYEREIKRVLCRVYGMTFDIQRLFFQRADDTRKYCCWVLDEEDIEKAMKEVGVPESYGLDVSKENRDAFIEGVVDNFISALGDLVEDWENELRGCVNDTIEQWQDREE